MKKYIIYAPSYSKSNGVRVLYKLRQLLEDKGYDAYIYALFSEQAPNTKFINKITSEMRKNDVVVYPEIVKGNPLEFQNVVRYILYFPGKIVGDTIYDSYEKVFTFAKIYKEDADVLFINNLDRHLFYTDNTTKDINAYFVYKGGKWKEVDEIKDAIEINSKYPETREELADLLRRTKILYSYDRHSILLDEAILCGCEVKIITEQGFEDYKPDDIALSLPNVIGLDNFIQITQKMAYEGKIRKYNKFKAVLYAVKLPKYILKFLIYKFIFFNKEKSVKYKNRVNDTLFRIQKRGI